MKTKFTSAILKSVLLTLTVCACLLNTANAQINCNQSTGIFYGVGNCGSTASGSGEAIFQYTLTANSLTLGSVTTPVAYTPPFTYTTGLAIADFGTGNKFYMTESFNHIIEYNGTSWNIVCVDTSGYPMHNAGGHGNYLYLQTQRNVSLGWPNRILKFDGTTLTTLWQDTTTTFGCADFAVDDNGNVYFFTGQFVGGAYITDFLKVMTPNGNILSSIPVAFDFTGFFGSFFLNNKMYVGFRSNPVYGDSLLEMTVSSSGISFGNRYHIPSPVVATSSSGAIHLLAHDFASCYGASINLETGVEKASLQNKIEIFPNPTTGILNLHFSNDENKELKIYNDLGVLLVIENRTGQNVAVDISNFPNGIYLMSITERDKTYSKKILKN
ncbi:MAG: T9SS type A sorting domain-containing protein [Bacteroidota bacterium]